MANHTDNDRPGWRARAACLEEDAELFFYSGSTGVAALGQSGRAKQVCERCPVKAICPGYALTTR